MIRILFFSDRFRPVAKKFRFLFIVLGRSFKILVRWNKKIELVYIDYSRGPIFENSLLVLNYNFNNVLWYELYPAYKTTNPERMILDMEKVPRNIEFRVHGFFRNQSYPISLPIQRILGNDTFKTNITIPVMPARWNKGLQKFSSDVIVKDTYPQIESRPHEIITPRLHIIHNTFKQTDFL
jgi:hypothetical protein